jgi:D-alanyl-D-alanine carboxypeptidase
MMRRRCGIAIAVVALSAGCIEAPSLAPDRRSASSLPPLRRQPAWAPSPVTGRDTVGEIARTSCGTAAVKPLSEQLLAEVNCLRPGALIAIDSIPGVNLSLLALPQLNTRAAQALRAALGDDAIGILSATRATAQQYVLHYWYRHGLCTDIVKVAARPGSSNHESGLAIDVRPFGPWRRRLRAHGYRWFGPADVGHFDYRGPGAVDLRRWSVRAFQRLWNRNHPNDRIKVNGRWNQATAARMDQAPAAGFAIGPSCEQ